MQLSSNFVNGGVCVVGPECNLIWFTPVNHCKLLLVAFRKTFFVAEYFGTLLVLGACHVWLSSVSVEIIIL